MKKILSILLILIILFSSFSVAATEIDENFNIDNYYTYTIELSQLSKTIKSDKEIPNSIDSAIEYVKSLSLSDKGYSYIEDACLAELEGYKNDDIELESYTVLIPKTRAKTYFGTYMNYDFYYEYTSAADFRRETRGDVKSAETENMWQMWMSAVIEIAVSIAEKYFSIPYTIVSIVFDGFPSGDNVSVYYGSYNEYVEQFYDVRTRTVYREESNGSLKACYQDQYSMLRINHYFCPVGVNYESDYELVGQLYNGSIFSNQLSKDAILKSAYTYANRNAMSVYKVSYHRINEVWV